MHLVSQYEASGSIVAKVVQIFSCELKKTLSFVPVTKMQKMEERQAETAYGYSCMNLWDLSIRLA